MIPLTKQERLVIAFVCAVLLAGVTLRFLSARFEFLNNFVNEIAKEKAR